MTQTDPNGISAFYSFQNVAIEDQEAKIRDLVAQLEQKDQQIISKDKRIRQLKEKCKKNIYYEDQISKLEKQVRKLEKVLETLEKQYLRKIISNGDNDHLKKVEKLMKACEC